MAMGDGAGRFPVIPNSGAGRGRRLERHIKVGDPIGGSGEEGCSPVSTSVVAWVGGGEQRW
jgi:hypothetical protein